MRLDVDIDDLKERVPIETYIASVTSLKKQGRHYMALCPFHSENTPSLVVTPEKQRFHCFGCGADGDIFDFIQRSLQVDLPTAIRQVAERAGVPIADSPADQAQATLLERLYAANAAAALRYQAFLRGPTGAAARCYLERRGITEQSMSSFGLGWAPEGDRELAEFLLTRSYDAQEMLTAGLMVRTRGEDAARPAFAGRLIFPVRDTRGRVCGFAARTISPGVQPKYLNTAETPTYSKSHLLYGLDLAQEAIRKEGCAVVVEGYLDVVRAHQCGHTHVVGVGGTAVSAEQLLLLRRCPKVVLALDGDPAGQRAQVTAGLAGQVVFAKQKREVALHVAVLPAAHDPDSLLAEDPAAFERLITEAPLLMDHVYARVLAAADRTQPTWRGTVLARLRRHLAVLSFGLRAHYVRRLAADLEIADERLWAELEGAPGAPPGKQTPQEPKTQRGPRAPAWLPRIVADDPASIDAAQGAAWREGLRCAEEYALGLLLPCAPLEGDLLALVRCYEPGTPALAPYFATLARGGTPDGSDVAGLITAVQRWPSVPPAQLPALVLSALRRAGTDRLRLAAETGEAPPGRLAGALRRQND